MGPYFIPASPADGKGTNGPSQYKCSWYAPGASGGVNIDGGAAADPETGMIYVGGQSGLSTITSQKDPCSEFRYSRRTTAAASSARCRRRRATTRPTRGRAAFAARASTMATASAACRSSSRSELGGITAYDMNTGDKKWWVPNGNVWREQTSNDPLFAGVTLPQVPAIGGQPEVITTKTLVIYGTGRSGGAGGGRGGPWRRGAVAAACGAAAAPAAITPQLYAFDKATGKQVGAVAIPSVNTAVPMTFLHQGKQYIVFATGVGRPHRA